MRKDRRKEIGGNTVGYVIYTLCCMVHSIKKKLFIQSLELFNSLTTLN